jgi:salicylate hydroxylase
MTIAVVGAGIGGLTLAVALEQRDLAVEVFEAAPALGEVGAGLTVSPNAGRVLDHLGLGDAVRARGVLPGVQHVADLATGATIRTLDRGDGLEARYGAPYRHLHRADLQAMLAGALAGRIRLGKRLEDVAADGTMRFADGEVRRADVVVGADGVRSVVRARLFGGGRAQFTGQVAWRGLVPVERLSAGDRAAPPGIHIGPGRLVLRYPVRAGALVNYAVFVEMGGWEAESWSIPSSRAELLALLPGACGLVRRTVEASDDASLHKWALHAREPLEGWTTGRVTLVGDAAHPMLPFLGQGAATAIEDAMVLARALAAFAPDEALRRYEAARRAHTALVQLHSRLIGLRFQGLDPEALGHGPLLNEEALGLFARDAVTEPI